MFRINREIVVAALGCALAAGVESPALATGLQGSLAPVSSGSITIRASVAVGGGLSSRLPATVSTGASALLCLWLNTGTGGYSIQTEATDPNPHTLRWRANDRSEKLEVGRSSRNFTAARRPGCASGQMAELSIIRKADTPGVPMTLLIVPE